MPVFDPLIFDFLVFDAGSPLSVTAVAQIALRAQSPIVIADGFAIAPTGAGNPTYPFRLFTGQVIGVKFERNGDLLRATLDCEDFNRLWPRLNVGAPNGASFLTQPDGTILGIDPDAQTLAPATSGGFVFVVKQYFLGHGNTSLDFVTNIQDLNGPPDDWFPDWSRQFSDLKAFADNYITYLGPYAKYWIDADLALWVTQLAKVGEVGDFSVPAPFTVDEDNPPSDGTLRPMHLDADWDFTPIVKRAFIRGGTEPASLWVDNPDTSSDILRAGETYHDSPGALYRDTALAIGGWAFANLYRAMLSGTVTVDPGHDGWRPGQTLYVTSTRLSQPGYPLIAVPTIIQSVTGKRVGGGPGLTLWLDVPGDVSNKVTWHSLSFENNLDPGSPGKATLVVEITDPDETFTVTRFDGVRIDTDGTADLEYSMTFGDVQVGTLADELAKIEIELPTTPRPVLHFTVTISDPTAPLVSGLVALLDHDVQVTAQTVDDSDKPVTLSQVPLEWVLYQWVDAAGTVPGDGIAFGNGTDLDAGLTDATGRAFNTLTQTGDVTSTWYEVKALALPIP